MYQFSLGVDFHELLTAYNVRNAVYAFGDAIDRIHTSLCGGGSMGVCDLAHMGTTTPVLGKRLRSVERRDLRVLFS